MITFFRQTTYSNSLQIVDPFFCASIATVANAWISLVVADDGKPKFNIGSGYFNPGRYLSVSSDKKYLFAALQNADEHSAKRVVGWEVGRFYHGLKTWYDMPGMLLNTVDLSQNIKLST